MSKLVHDIRIDMLHSRIPNKIELVKLDTGRQIHAHIIGLDLTGYSATVWVTKPSGLKVWNDCVISGQKVIIDVTNQMLAEKGEAVVQIKFSSDTDGLVSAPEFLFNVKRDVSGDALQSQNESTVLDQMVKDIIDNNLAVDVDVDENGDAELSVMPASAVVSAEEVEPE